MPEHPLSDAFWDEQVQKMNSLFASTFEEILRKGFDIGNEILEARGISAVSFDLVNESVSRYGRQTAGVFSDNLSEGIRNQLSEEIPDWVDSGEPLDELMKNLRSLFGRVRANRIAVTETTRLYAAGNERSWIESGVVVAKTWKVVGDDLVCPICEKIAEDTPTVPLESDGFQYSPGNQSFRHPPAHVNCRCAIRPVVDKEGIDFGD